MNTGVDSSVILRGNLEGVIMPPCLRIEAGTVLQLGNDASLLFGLRNTIYMNCSIRTKTGNIVFGDDVSLGPGVQIYEVRGGLTIGSMSLIGGGVLISGVNHNFSCVSTPIREQGVTSKKVTIGSNVWIGMGTIILPGVNIGDNSIIGAGSIVTRDIDENVIAYGQPCKPKRSR